MFRRPIAISLSPNTQSKDVLYAFKMLLFPWRYMNGKYTGLLEQWFRQNYKVSYAISFVSGRGALYAILKSLGVGKGDEVILQAFTCVAVSDSIIATGAKPIYADIDSSLTIDPEDFKKKITSQTKAVIIQHTFGIPASQKIKEIAKAHKISVIEDCAHLVGASYNGKKLGLYSDAAFFSFGRDKAFSSVFGGMAITNNQGLGKKIRFYQKQKGNPSLLWVAQQLFHPIAFYFILPFYNFLSLGKVLLVLLQALHFLSFPVTPQEKQGKLPVKFVRKLPNALGFLALAQLKKIKEYNQKREQISNFYLTSLARENITFPYEHSLAFLRFPVLIENRDRVVALFKKKGIYLGKWYSETIDPKGVNFNKIFYQKGSCPNAEYFSERILNLPTYPTMRLSEAKKVTELLKKYVKDFGN